MAIADQRPGEFVRAKIGGHRDSEKAPLPSRQEMSRLPLVGPAGFNAVIWSDGDFQVFSLIAVVVTEKKTERAVLIFEPSLEGARNTLPRIMPGL